MPTYSVLDVVMASPTEPLPIEKRMYQLTAMWEAMENITKSPTPTIKDWEAVADGINMMEALKDLGAVEDPDNALRDAINAMEKAGMRSTKGANIRLDGKSITLIRGILQDYCDALEALPARTIISAHRYAEKRIQDMLKGKKRPHDVVVKK